MNNNSITRPRLKKVNPLVSWATLGFAFFNLLLGAALMSDTARTLEFFIINDFLSTTLWGSLFFLTGLYLLYGYWRDSWKIMRNLMVVGLFLKFIWSIALIVRQVEDPGTNVFLILMFMTLAFLQIGVYLYFPESKEVESWKRS